MERWDFYSLLDERMANMYGRDVPDVITKRYVREKNYLQLSKFQDEFRVFAELLIEMQKKQIRYSGIGTFSHSFLLHLLLHTEMNPLPPHYYCPQCKKILFIDDDEISMGIDLPRMQCKCGHELSVDGFDLSEEFFWEKEKLDLVFSVSEENYEFIKNWLCKDNRMQDREREEDDYKDESIVKRFNIGIITVLSEKAGFLKTNEIAWEDVRKQKEKVIENYELLLPCNKKIGNNPRNLYEVIRVVAFFNTMYTKSTKCYVSEDDILDAEEMYLLLEKYYDSDISSAPVFQEDGLMLGEWNVGEYDFLIMFTRAFAEYVLDEINDKMSMFFYKEKVDE